MSFKILNKNNEKGDYGFTGFALPNRSCNLCCSEQEIEDVKQQIIQYTKTQPRDYILTFENEHGQQVHAVDNISLTEIEERKENGETDQDIQALNYYDLKFVG